MRSRAIPPNVTGGGPASGVRREDRRPVPATVCRPREGELQSARPRPRPGRRPCRASETRSIRTPGRVARASVAPAGADGSPSTSASALAVSGQARAHLQRAFDARRHAEGRAQRALERRAQELTGNRDAEQERAPRGSRARRRARGLHRGGCAGRGAASGARRKRPDQALSSETGGRFAHVAKGNSIFRPRHGTIRARSGRCCSGSRRTDSPRDDGAPYCELRRRTRGSPRCSPTPGHCRCRSS